MGQKYVQADANGIINAFYDADVNSESQIGTALAITDEQWMDCVNNPGKWMIVAGALQLAPPPPDVPPIVIPQSVTMRQARLALFQAGLLAQVDTVIAAMTSPQKEVAQIEWQYSSEVHRNKSLVQTLGPDLGLSDAQLDQLFITAATL